MKHTLLIWGHQTEGKRDWPDQLLGSIVPFFRDVIGVWKGTQIYFQGQSPHLGEHIHDKMLDSSFEVGDIRIKRE